MTDISKLCMVCLGSKDESGLCPVCREEGNVIQASPLLPIKSILNQRYLIAKAQKKNCEGITYTAFDMTLNREVSVREFFPEEIAQRDADLITVSPKTGSETVYSRYLDAFTALWNKIMRLKGITALITVSTVFSANGTAYAVYDESERETLRDRLINSTPEGYFTWEKARILFMPVLSTLGTLHTSGVFHKGINPDSFIFSKDGKLKLTDFCIDAARSLTGALTAERFDGYAAFEQYELSNKAEAVTDIYSFCSVLYRTLIGTNPIDARTRAENDRMMIPAKFAEQLPPYVIHALINGMAIYPEDRTDNIEQLRSDLSASQRAIGASAPAYQPKPVVNQPKPVVNQPKTSPYIDPISVVEQMPSAPKQSEPRKPEKKQPTQPVKSAPAKGNKLVAVLCAIIVIFMIGIGFLVGEIVKLKSPSEEQTTASQSTIVAVPNFVGGYISDIITNKQYTDYFIFNTVKQSSSTVMEGIVIDQNIPPQSQASKGETIILTVSSGPRVFALPDVTSYTYEAAEQLLTSQGLRVVRSELHNDGTHEGGKVAETIPEKNSVVKEGDTITIVVYTSEEEETSAATTPNQGGNAVEEFLEGFNNTTTQSQQ